MAEAAEVRRGEQLAERGVDVGGGGQQVACDEVRRVTCRGFGLATLRALGHAQKPGSEGDDGDGRRYGERHELVAPMRVLRSPWRIAPESHGPECSSSCSQLYTRRCDGASTAACDAPPTAACCRS